MSAVDHAEDQFLTAEEQGLLLFLFSSATDCGPLRHYSVAFHDPSNLPNHSLFVKQTYCKS